MRKKRRNNKRSKSRKKSRKSKSRKKSRKSKSRKKSKKIESKELIFKVPKRWAKKAYVDKNLYEKKYNLSIKDNENFWRKEGKRINWIKP